MLTPQLFIICLGPICVPIYGLLPFLALAWAWLRGKLGYGQATDDAQREKLDFSKEKNTENGNESGQGVEAKEGQEINNENDHEGGGLKQRKSAKSGEEDKYHSGEVLPMRGLGEFRACLNNEQKLPVLVDFGATWCGPCKKIKPLYKQLAAANKGKAIFITVDVDQGKELADLHKVNSIPDFRVYVEGKERNGFKGADSNRLRNLLNTYVK
jgi:thioredoxin 1